MIKFRTNAIVLLVMFGLGNPVLGAPSSTLLCEFVCNSITDGKTCSKEVINVTYVLPTRHPFPTEKKAKIYTLPGKQEITKEANGIVNISSTNSALTLYADGTAGRVTLYIVGTTDSTIRSDSGSFKKVAI